MSKKYGLPVWFSAAEQNDTNNIKHLMGQCAKSIDGKNRWTALMFAAYHNSFEVAQLLAGKESGMENIWGYTALMIAAAKNNHRIVQLLVPKEAGMFLFEDTIDFPKNTTALLIAASLGHLESASHLFRAEAKVSQFTQAHFQALNKDFDALLLGHVSSQYDLLERTPVFYACIGRDEPLESELHCCHVLGMRNTLHDIFGRLPLHYCLMFDNISLYREVSNNTVSTNLTAATKYTEHVANQLQILPKMKTHSKLTNIPLYYQFSEVINPLMLSCCYNSRECIKGLTKDFGGQQTDDGFTALMFSVLFNGYFSQQLYDLECRLTTGQHVGLVHAESSVFDIAGNFCQSDLVKRLNKCRDTALEFGAKSKMWESIESTIKTRPAGTQEVAEQAEGQGEVVQEQQKCVLENFTKSSSRGSDDINEQEIEKMAVKSLKSEQQLEYAKELIFEYIQEDDILQNKTLEEILLLLAEQELSTKPSEVRVQQSLKIEELNSTGQEIPPSTTVPAPLTHTEAAENFDDLAYLQEYVVRLHEQIDHYKSHIGKQDSIISKQLHEIKEQVMVNKNLQTEIDELEVLVQELDDGGQ